MRKFTFTSKSVNTVVLMSGSGTNTRALLEYERTCRECAYHITGLVTDAPETSRTEEIAQEYCLPWAHCDIRQFYARHGEDSIKLDSPRRRILRNEWSKELYQVIKKFPCEFLLFAGFLALTNLAERIPCLNVHPGDLTVCDQDGTRLYTGLHVLPVEDAILNGDEFLRSSVILVQPYTGNGAKDMDAGPIPGISGPVAVDRGRYSLEELHDFRKNRIPGIKCTDPLRVLAREHIEKLKIQGDHIVFPRAASDFAAGCFACGEEDQLFYRGQEILTVEYTAEAEPHPICRKS